MDASSSLPDGRFLSFDSILKSFFSPLDENRLSPRSGQRPSTVLAHFSSPPCTCFFPFAFLYCVFFLVYAKGWVLVLVLRKILLFVQIPWHGLKIKWKEKNICMKEKR